MTYQVRSCIVWVECLLPLGVSHTSLQLVMVSLQISKFHLMTSLHLRNMGLELLESVVVCHDC